MSPDMAAEKTGMTSFLTTRIRLLGWALAATGMAAATLVLFVLATVSFPLVVVWAGIPLLIFAAAATKPLANAHRRAAARLLNTDIASPYLAPKPGNLLIRWRVLLTDRATWRDLAWVAANGTAGLALAIAGIVEAVLDLLLWWLPPGMMMRVHAYLAMALLSPTTETTLAQRVQQLADTRAEQVDMSAAELRRIERDLHDGAQARIVSLGMTLGMAEEQIATNPDAAKALLTEARQSSSTALTELRDLVRGIHPPVLADRGLTGAVEALALAAPFPVEVTSTLAVRLPAPVESAAYFVIAEAITNAVKHSGASHATVTIDHRPGVLRFSVIDNGTGGADSAAGTGLRGIQRRLAAFDGTLTLTSPTGGPTELDGMLPL